MHPGMLLPLHDVLTALKCSVFSSSVYVCTSSRWQRHTSAGITGLARFADTHKPMVANESNLKNSRTRFHCLLVPRQISQNSMSSGM